MPYASVRDFPPPKGIRSAIVTGASQGIGRSTAEALALDGWNVLISGRRVEVLQASVKSITARVCSKNPQSEVQVRMYVGDMGDEAAVQNMFARATELFDRIDLVFINAGAGAPPVPIQQLSFQQWSTVVHINLNGGVYYPVHLCVFHLTFRQLSCVAVKPSATWTGPGALMVVASF